MSIEKSKVLSKSVLLLMKDKYLGEIKEVSGDMTLPVCSFTSDNSFLQADFFRAVANATPKGLRQFVVIIRNQAQAICGLIVVQHLHFNAFQSMRKTPPSGIFDSFRQHIIYTVANQIQTDAIIVGNVMVTGHPAMAFSTDFPAEDRCDLLDSVAQEMSQYFQQLGLACPVVFFKDVAEAAPYLHTFFESKGFMAYRFLPNMFMNIRPHWDQFDDYLADMTSKYRVRTRKALKDGASLKAFEMTETQVELFEPKMYELYLKVVEQAPFNAITLHPTYFSAMKLHLGQGFKVFGYEYEGELVGFISLVCGEKTLDAHFVGIDEQINKECQLYFNMLLKMVDCAIQGKYERLVFSRTAMEIKSSVGAKGQDLISFVKHQKPVGHFVLGKVVSYLSPDNSWVPRNPFKD